MNEIAIIIPSRLDAKRLPNKPLKLINDKEMILHVHEVACNANIGEVYVATPDQEVFDLIKKNGGKASLTSKKHLTGTDRVYEVFKKDLKKNSKIIINLQGDMPNIKSESIKNLANYMKKNLCDIATLGSDLNKKEEENNPNVVKLITEQDIKKINFSNALDFYRISKNMVNYNIFHHIGIYAFTSKALIRYVSLERSKLELERKLEQLRALENDMKIHAGYVNYSPLSVDTEEDLIKVRKIMKK